MLGWKIHLVCLVCLFIFKLCNNIDLSSFSSFFHHMCQNICKQSSHPDWISIYIYINISISNLHFNFLPIPLNVCFFFFFAKKPPIRKKQNKNTNLDPQKTAEKIHAAKRFAPPSFAHHGWLCQSPDQWSGKSPSGLEWRKTYAISGDGGALFVFFWVVYLKIWQISGGGKKKNRIFLKKELFFCCTINVIANHHQQ